MRSTNFSAARKSARPAGVEPLALKVPNAVVMVRPRHFCLKLATATNKAIQTAGSSQSDLLIARKAFCEVTDAASALIERGITVHLFEDDRCDRPESVFPNWFSTHAGGRIVVYPMLGSSPPTERRLEIIDALRATHQVKDVLDLSGLERHNAFLEGTTTMVLDQVARIAYAARSNRCDPAVLKRFCSQFDFEPVVFEAYEKTGRAMYRTQVMLTVATEFVLVGLYTIADTARRKEIAARLAAPGRDLIELDAAQIAAFAGNAIELQGSRGRVLALSTTAVRALTRQQIRTIERSAELLPIDVTTIELAGGSVGCLLAGIYLDASLGRSAKLLGRPKAEEGASAMGKPVRSSESFCGGSLLHPNAALGSVV